ncbi:hypothetical protein NFI96_014645 [Prochilodus magdalenae]|nr:hypothetical protein NFI96_014645 [Prochilodus magdalenae]
MADGGTSEALHTDMDRGDGRTRYVLRGEGAGSVFVIDEKTGNIHVTKPLDREEKDEYRLIATATDSQTERALEPSSQFIIRVQDINDNPPVFEDGPYSATVPEMANIGPPQDHHRIILRAAVMGWWCVVLLWGSYGGPDL